MQKLTAAFTSLYQQNQHLVKLSPSLHESNTEALFLADGIRGNEPLATDMLREISHFHGTGDHSVHVTLPPQDCKYIQYSTAQYSLELISLPKRKEETDRNMYSVRRA